jgi:hypothetical protein
VRSDKVDTPVGQGQRPAPLHIDSAEPFLSRFAG